MGFVSRCLELGIKINDDDIKLIKWKLRMLPEILHKQILEKYIIIYFEELEKQNINNFARESIAKHYANRFIKLYR
jgi:hypothetical protein